MAPVRQWNQTSLVIPVGTRQRGRAKLYLVSQAARKSTDPAELSNELLDALDEHAIVSVADLEGRIIYANDKFCEVSGYRRNELIGQTHRIVKSGAHNPDFYEDLWQTISSGKVWHGVLANRRKSGDVYWVASTIVPMLDEHGLPERYVSIRTDISKQKQLEQSVRDQQAFLQHVTEALGEGVLVTDPQGRCVYASGEALRLLRRRSDEVIGWSIDGFLVGQLAPAGRAAAREDARRSAATRWRAGRFQGIFECGDGKRMPVALHVRMLGGRRSPQASVVVFHDDTTERRKRAGVLRQTAAAERANLAKTAFVSNLSHEIRTPLNGIVGLIRLARDEPAGSERIASYLRLIEASAATLSELVSDVLDLSRIEAGKLVLEPVDFDLHELVQSIWEVYVEQAQLASVQLTARVDPGVERYVFADRMRLRQIVVNFVSNALKFTPAGSVAFVVRPVNGGFTRFEVRDTGIGIEPSTLAGLFKPFVQGDESMSRRFGGTGLGLSICRELARGMGGDVGVASSPGQGSTFWAELPLAASTRIAGAETAGGVSEVDLTGVRVLLAEDNEVNTIVACALLEKWGCEVTSVINGQAAVQRVTDSRGAFDVVLMDLQMPVLGGRQAAVLLRQRYTAAQLPIVALTATALPRERHECLALGMNEYLTKPIDPQALRVIIARLCGRTGALGQ